MAHTILVSRQELPEETPLLRFLAGLDRLTSPDLPADRQLWMAALAMPLVLDAGLRRQAAPAPQVILLGTSPSRSLLNLQQASRQGAGPQRLKAQACRACRPSVRAWVCVWVWLTELRAHRQQCQPWPCLRCCRPQTSGCPCPTGDAAWHHVL